MRNILKNSVITSIILALASFLCFLLQGASPTDTHVPLIFVLAVLCVSRFTTGFVYGILASIIAVIAVNYVFTFPYFELNFTITGYPLTFIVMFAVSIIVSALTTQIKRQEEIRLEIEREKIRGNLFRTVSHDIRTPLTSIIGTASAILEQGDGLTDDEKTSLLKGIQQEGQWLYRIVENILSITRINNSPEMLYLGEELAEEVVGSAISKFKKREPDVEVVVTVPEEPLLVPMDPILIEQVLINLLDNAVEHGGNLHTVIIKVKAEESFAYFSVEDDGHGISPEILPHIFDDTLALDQKDTDRKSSMQIGLSVCMSVIKAHKGFMYAENRTEGGARVSFRIPLNKG